jgi:hypothetical protein
LLSRPICISAPIPNTGHTTQRKTEGKEIEEEEEEEETTKKKKKTPETSQQ